MNRKLALLLSIIFQPLLVPSLVFVILLYLIPEATIVPEEIKFSMLLLVIVSTLLIPLLSVLGMRYMRTIPSLQMGTKQERFLPFSMVSLFYGVVTYYFYARIHIDELVVFTLLTITVSIVLLTFITFFWKISAHITGLSGLIAITVVLSLKFQAEVLLYPLIGIILICGLVGSSRLYLNAHRPLEVLGGFCLGFITCFVSFYYFLLL
ncbi:PA-phosphatase [Echinicola jeungdonensis]|uniref:PA-phosphatase n=1 Tax=Echinicola jeungdonensis TaxID=709343 RepID=A0ABV5J3P2_9BACT|nr:PA-phosphatase [Echinicola jeungdonensis]MDN3668175.1 PA-phosphatase [Echinicola jeungdonensis]